MIAAQFAPKKLTIQQLVEKAEAGLLVMPAFQRRQVWSDKQRSALVLSIAAGLPIGTIVLAGPKDGPWEVLDGKQRLGSILSFVSIEQPPEWLPEQFELEATSSDRDIMSRLEQEDANPRAADFFERLRTDATFHAYPLLLTIVHPDEHSARTAFQRLNRNPTPLSAHEMRRATFIGDPALNAIDRLAHQLSKLAPVYFDARLNRDAKPFMVALDVTSASGAKRYADEQTLVELINVVHYGVSNRRDEIDRLLEADKTPKTIAKIEKSAEKLMHILDAVARACDGEGLRSLHFNTQIENDLYSIVGALSDLGLDRRLDDRDIQKLRRRLIKFRLEVLREYRHRRNSAKYPDGSELKQAQRYLESYFGQANSETNRKIRIRVWKSQLRSMFPKRDRRRLATRSQKDMLWAESATKTCTLCDASVRFSYFVAGHVVAWATGGPTEDENLQIECPSCSASQKQELIGHLLGP